MSSHNLAEWLRDNPPSLMPRPIRPLVPLVPRLPAVPPEPRARPRARQIEEGPRLCECGEPSLKPKGERTCERCAKLESSYMNAVWGGGKRAVLDARKPSSPQTQYRPNPPEYPQLDSRVVSQALGRTIRRLNHGRWT